MDLTKLLAADARCSQRMRIAEKPGILRVLAAFLAHSGDSWFWVLGLLLVYWQAEPAWKGWALRSTVTILAAALLVGAIKFTVRRSRPYGEWGGIYRNTDPHSFPSGHATRAAMLAITALAWSPAPWLAWVLLLWAPLVGLARVAMGVHFLSDIIIGFLLGAGIGILAPILYP
jgi:undecaprenyl-diphosphatase